MGINYSPDDFNIPHKSRNFRSLDYGFYGRGYKAYTPSLGIIDHSMKMASGDVPGQGDRLNGSGIPARDLP